MAKAVKGTVVIQDAKSRTVDANMFVTGSRVPLTHGQRAVGQGHVVFEAEALAQTLSAPMRVKHTDKCENVPLHLFLQTVPGVRYLFIAWEKRMLSLSLAAVSFTQLLSTNILVITLDIGMSVLSATEIHLPKT